MTVALFDQSAGSLITDMIRRGVAALGQSTFDGRQVNVVVNGSGHTQSAPFNLSNDAIWASQPHVRTVVDFQARNIAQLGLHVFRRDGEDRERVRGDDSAAARVLARPNEWMTGLELIEDLVATRAVWGDAYWFIMDGEAGDKQIVPFPPSWVSQVHDTANMWTVREWRIQPPGSDRWIKVDDTQVVRFRGWNASSMVSASSPMDTIRDILEERYHSRRHRIQLWRRNGRVGSYIARPKDAPSWDTKARRRFYEMFDAFTGDHGARAGGVPILEDGMTINSTSFKSADEQWAESEKLSLETVAQVYQINPTMVGVLDNANYSNVREFNKQLYTNTLGPEIRKIEARINEFVLPLIGGQDGEFVEFNVAEKLRGSFEEQASIMSTSTGGPWLTRNEARRMQNLPPLDDADELIVPLNVTSGGQASPQDGGDGRPVDPTKAAEVWERLLQRQLAAVPGKMTGPDWWDKDRWDRELTADLAAAGEPDPPGKAAALNEKTKKALDGDRDNPVAVFNALIREAQEGMS